MNMYYGMKRCRFCKSWCRNIGDTGPGELRFCDIGDVALLGDSFLSNGDYVCDSFVSGGVLPEIAVDAAMAVDDDYLREVPVIRRLAWSYTIYDGLLESLKVLD